MKVRIAAVLAAAILIVVPVSVANAAETCVKLSLPSETVCSPNGFVHLSAGEKFKKVYRVERTFDRPDDRRSPRSLFRHTSYRLVFVGYLLSEQGTAK